MLLKSLRGERRHEIRRPSFQAAGRVSVGGNLPRSACREGAGRDDTSTSLRKISDQQIALRPGSR
jgi:hypothetical protein